MKKRWLQSNGFEPNFIKEAKIKIRLPDPTNKSRHFHVTGFIITKDEITIEGREYIQITYEKHFTVFTKTWLKRLFKH